MIKSLTAVIFCVFVCFNTFGQSTKTSSAEPKNEIGIHILSYSTNGFSDKYAHISISDEEQKPFHLLNGISYKRHINQHIIRASFNYRNLHDQPQKPSYIYHQGNYDESTLKIGYEKNLNSRKLTPYLAADLSMIYVLFKGFRKGDSPGYSEYNINGIGGGISPAFGLKYKLTNHLSLNAESCLDLVYFRFNHKESTERFPNATFSTYKFDTRFNPLQKLSLNVKF
jgi:hypothetical protein